jgi:hypothetical protein
VFRPLFAGTELLTIGMTVRADRRGSTADCHTGWLTNGVLILVQAVNEEVNEEMKVK